MRGRPGPGEKERRPARGPFCLDPLEQGLLPTRVLRQLWGLEMRGFSGALNEPASGQTKSQEM